MYSSTVSRQLAQCGTAHVCMSLLVGLRSFCSVCECLMLVWGASEGHLTMLPSSCWSKHLLGGGGGINQGAVLFGLPCSCLRELSPEIMPILVFHKSWIMGHGLREVAAPTRLLVLSLRPLGDDAPSRPASCLPTCLPAYHTQPSMLG